MKYFVSIYVYVMFILADNLLDSEIISTIADAKAKGYTIEVRHAKVMVCGSSAAGKSNFVKLLLKDDFVKEHKPTALTIAKDTMVKEMMLKESDDVVQFEELSLKYQIKILKSHLHYKLYGKEYAESSKFTPPKETPKPPEGNVKPDEFIHTEQKNSGKSSPVSMLSKSITEKESDSVKSEAYASDIEKKLAEKSEKDIEKLPEIWNMLTFLDTGGQPEYITMLPAINSSVMVTFVVLSLEYDLSQKVTVFKGDNEPYPLPYDYETLIKMLMSIRKPQTVEIPENVLAKKGKRISYLSFIGTKSDIVTNVLKKDLKLVVNSINEKLKSIVAEAVCEPNLIRFVDDNYLTDVCNCNKEDEHAILIRSKLYAKLKDSADTYHIPIPWLLLELEIKDWCKKNEKRCMKLQEILNLCSQNPLLKNNEEEVKKFLKFYHILGVFLYYNTDGYDIAIIDVQWFFTNLSNLVIFTTRSNDRFSYEHLLKFGLVTNEIFKKMEFDETDAISIDYFIKLFQDLGIMGVYSESDKEIYYFVPCILFTCSHNNDEEITLLSKYGKREVEPLLLHACDGEIPEENLPCVSYYYGFPRGAFCRLAVYLVKKENTNHIGKFNLLLSEGCLYSNLIIFQYFPNNQPDCYVVLVDRYTYLEIQIRFDQISMENRVYHDIRDLLSDSFSIVLQYLQFSFSTVCLAFKCSYCKSGDHLTRNTMDGIKANKRFQCQGCGRQSSYSENVWFKDQVSI